MSAPGPHDPRTAAHAAAQTVGTVPQATRPTPSGALPAVPGYELVRELARGGMAVVYLGRDPVFGRPVAVKVMFPGQDGNRFVVEARITGQLSHPGVPPVYALGALPDGRPFLAMKLIEGRTFADELAAAPGDAARHLSACERVCETVGFAHARGIVHRDLKPSNVMVGPFGEVLVMDWGLARDVRRAERAAGTGTATEVMGPSAREPNVQETVAGAVKGTPAYMAPEQARGEPVDARADVFALGGILAAALTGRPPFAGNTVLDTVLRAAQAELDDCFARLDECGADPELVAVTKRCLAADPADRFATGTEVAAALAAYRTGAQERVRQAERATAVSAAEAREQRKRRKLQLALVTGAAGALVAVGGALWARDHQQRLRERETAEAAATAARLETEVERNRAAARVRAARTRAEVEALLARAEDALRASAVGTADVLLAEADKRLREGGAEALAPRAAQCRAALDTLHELLDIDRLAFTVNAQQSLIGARNTIHSEKTSGVNSSAGAATTGTESQLLPAEALADHWARALGPYGIGTERAPTDGQLAALLASPIRGQLTDTISRWCVAKRSSQLAAVLDRIDPDPFRTEVRKGVCASDGRAVEEALKRPEVRDLPRAMAVALAAFDDLSADRRRELLLAAQAREPGDLTVLMHLGRLETRYPTGGPAVEARWYQAAVAAHPNTVAAWNNLGTALTEVGDPRGAARALERATALAPDLPTAWNNRGLALRDAGDVKGARAAYTRALQLNAKYAEAHSNLGALEYAQGNRAEAVARFRTAIECKPKYALGYSNLGLALTELGQVDAGVAAIRTAIELDPKLPLAHCNLAVALNDKGDYAGALAACTEALKLRPDYPEAFNNRASAYEQSGRPKEAIAAALEALKRRPNFPAALNTLGSAFRALPDLDRAAAAYAEALKFDPKFVPALNNLAAVLANRGDAKGALALYLRAVEADPNLAVTHFNLGRFYERARKPAEARAAYEAAIKCDPKFPDALNNLGSLLERAGDLDGAEARYREALKHAPNYAFAHHNLGIVLARQKKPAEAADAFENAVRCDPRLIPPLLQLVELHIAARDFPRALDAARRAVARDPQAAELRALEGKILFALKRTEDARDALERAAALDRKFRPLLAQLPPAVAPPPRAK